MNDFGFSKLEISDAKIGEGVKDGGNEGPASKDSDIDSSFSSKWRHLNEFYPFTASKLAALVVDPVELIGKTIKTFIALKGQIGTYEVNKYPGVYGLVFADDTKYQVRVCNEFHENAYVGMKSEENIVEDGPVGKQITFASLVKFKGGTFYSNPYLGILSRGRTMAFVALGIKCQGSDQWLIFYGSEEDYNSDGDGLSMSLP